MKHPLTDIRLCTESDLAAVLDVFEETIRTSCAGDYTDAQIEAWVAGRNDIEKWRRRLREQFFIVALVEERLAGFGSLGEIGYVDLLYVHPDFQGKGVATAIFNEIERCVTKENTEILTSDVSKTARPFFEKMGFVVEREQFQTVRGVQIENYRMVKNV